MSSPRQTPQQEFEEWKRALPLPARGRKAAAARQLRDNLRTFTFGFRDWLEEAMRPHGLTVAQLRMLFAVRYEPEGSSARIARLCQVTPQTLQSMLERAVREGWLLRHAAAHNARILVSSLTPKGEALLGHAMDATAAFEQQVWRDCSTEELQGINAAFERALRRMETAAAVPFDIHGERPDAPAQSGSRSRQGGSRSEQSGSGSKQGGARSKQAGFSPNEPARTTAQRHTAQKPPKRNATR